MMEWNLPEELLERIILAQGGNVTEMRWEYLEIFRNTFRIEFSRDTYAFYDRPL